jgi:hypothetical protein
MVRFYDSEQDRLLLFPKRPSAAVGANYLPTLQDVSSGGTVLQVDQAASAN